MFYKEINFKDTEIGRIPKEWEVVRLGEMAKNMYYGVTAKAVDRKTKYRMLRTTDIKDYKTDWNSLPFCEVTEKRNDISKYLLQKGDLIIARAGTAGVSVLVDKELDNVIFGSYLIKVELRKGIYAKFLHYFLQSDLYWRYIISQQAGSTLKNISLPILKSLKIPLPPLEEQQKIAHVLMSIDKAIETIDEAIKQAERIKKGLMQELLTKGVGHKEFKDTEIGRIPKEWEVVKLGDVAEIRKNKVRNDLTEVAFIPMELVPDTEIFAKYEVRNISDISSSTYCEANDLLLAKITPSFENGKQGIVPIDIPNGFAFATTEVYPIVCKDINNLFLFYLLKFQKFRRLLEFSMRGTTGRRRVPKKAVEDFKIPLPPLQEQQKIVEILSKWDEIIELKKAKKERLERMKKKVMDLLLTGKVRVRTEEDQNAPTA